MNEQLFVTLMDCLLEAKPNGFTCDTFEFHPYSFNDEDNEETPLNFYYKPGDIGADWYKHPGRGMHGDSNKMTVLQILEMGVECFKAMSKT